MKIIICGAGQVGYNITKYLASEEDMHVVLVDHDAELISRISQDLDVQAVVGYAGHPDVLERVGADSADIIIAVTKSDEINMVVCQVAHSLFNIPTKVARIRDQSYLKSRAGELFTPNHIPIDFIISPEYEVARTIARNLSISGAFDIIPLMSEQVKVIGVRCSEECPVINTPLLQLANLFPDLRVTILCIVRDGTAMIPSRDDQLLPGDDVYLCTDRLHISRAMSIFGVDVGATTSVLVLGAGNVGLGFCQEVEQKRPDINITVIERSQERA